MSYAEAKARYAAIGVDTEAAIARLKTVPISLHCWQGDDVRGFDTDPTKPLTGGIQTTGNYPGRARTPEELMADMDKVLSLCPGTKKINLHASYAIFDEENPWVDRDKLEPKHFKKWVDFCKARGLGADFNPTFFSHPKCDPLTLASPNEETRKFWVEHGKACIRISQYLAEELGQPCTMNIWTGDGFKDVPADRKGPRDRYKASIDEILSEPYDFKLVKPCIESKVFGIGVEAYTVGSAEFALSYAAFNRKKCIPLMDNGHYHPTEVVSDKIPALLAFFPEIALHVTRPIRWDSDHVVLFDDETKEICKEIVRCGGLDGRVNMGVQADNLAGEYFITTGSGKFFRNVEPDHVHSIGIVEINEKGDSWRIVWGLEGGAKPTSEFPSHFMNHSVRKAATNGANRVIYHCHATNVIALTYILPLTDRDFTRALWQSATECPVVFPEGVGVCPWMVPGGADIAMATSELMKTYQAAIWAQHGLFASGPDFDITFGLAHTIEKSAEIYVKVLSMGGGIIRQTITDDDLRAIARDFGVTLNEKFLN